MGKEGQSVKGTEKPVMYGSYPELAEEALYRARIYQISSTTFLQEPSVEDLAHIVEACVIDSKSFVSENDKAFPELEADRQSPDSYQVLCEKIAQYKGYDLNELRTKIATEYAEMFIGPRQPLAPLFESVYSGPNERLFTDVTVSVRKCYEEAGLEVIRKNRVPDDHLGLELEFMATLCSREYNAWCEEDEHAAMNLRAVQLRFLEEHLAKWTHAFADRVAEGWCADYYGTWSVFVADFVDEDIEYLQR